MEDVIKARESIAMTRGNPGCRIAKLIDAVLAQIPVGSNRIHFSHVVSSEESGLLPVRLRDFSLAQQEGMACTMT